MNYVKRVKGRYYCYKRGGDLIGSRKGYPSRMKAESALDHHKQYNAVRAASHGWDWRGGAKRQAKISYDGVGYRKSWWMN